MQTSRKLALLKSELPILNRESRYALVQPPIKLMNIWAMKIDTKQRSVISANLNNNYNLWYISSRQINLVGFLECIGIQ